MKSPFLFLFLSTSTLWVLGQDSPEPSVATTDSIGQEWSYPVEPDTLEKYIWRSAIENRIKARTQYPQAGPENQFYQANLEEAVTHEGESVKDLVENSAQDRSHWLQYEKRRKSWLQKQRKKKKKAKRKLCKKFWKGKIPLPSEEEEGESTDSGNENSSEATKEEENE